MLINEAQKFFEMGILRSYHLEKSLHTGGWFIRLYGDQLPSGSEYIATKRDPRSPREFASIDTVFATLAKIGWEVKVLEGK